MPHRPSKRHAPRCTLPLLSEPDPDAGDDNQGDDNGQGVAPHQTGITVDNRLSSFGFAAVGALGATCCTGSPVRDGADGGRHRRGCAAAGGWGGASRGAGGSVLLRLGAAYLGAAYLGAWRLRGDLLGGRGAEAGPTSSPRYTPQTDPAAGR